MFLVSMFLLSYHAKIANWGRRLHFKIIMWLKIMPGNSVKMSNTFKPKQLTICSFHLVYKTNIDCSLFGAQFKIIGPSRCQNHGYALSFASGIVMVLTSPWPYNFNSALQSSQYLYASLCPYVDSVVAYVLVTRFPQGPQGSGFSVQCVHGVVTVQ